MNPFLLYLILMLDNINSLFYGIAVLSVAALFIGAMLYAIGIDESSGQDKAERLRKSRNLFVKILILIVIASSVCHAFIPTTNQMAVIYGLPKMLNNKDIQVGDLTGDEMEEDYRGSAIYG